MANFSLVHSRTPHLATRCRGRLRALDAGPARRQFAENSYLRVFTYSAIDLACASVSPAMPLLCGGLLVDSPFVRCSAIRLVSRFVPLIAGAFMAGLPAPSAPWQPAHFVLYRAAPSSAAHDVARAIRITTHKLSSRS